MRESGSPEIRAPRETDCGNIGSAEPLRSRRRRCRHRSSGLAMIELPGVLESGMPRRNGQRKPGTRRCYTPVGWDRLAPWGECRSFWNRLAVSPDLQGIVEQLDARAAMGAEPNPNLPHLWMAAIIRHPLAYARTQARPFQLGDLARRVDGRAGCRSAENPCRRAL